MHGFCTYSFVFKCFECVAQNELLILLMNAHNLFKLKFVLLHSTNFLNYFCRLSCLNESLNGWCKFGAACFILDICWREEWLWIGVHNLVRMHLVISSVYNASFPKIGLQILLFDNEMVQLCNRLKWVHTSKDRLFFYAAIVDRK